MITFFFGYKTTGGVPRLFFNLAREMSKNSIPFRLICHRDSEVYKAFQTIESPFEFLSVKELKKNYKNNTITENDTIIITYFDKNLSHLMEINPKILFWNVFPDYLLNVNKTSRFIRKKNKTIQLVKALSESKGLTFMDDSALFHIRRELELEIKPVIVPLPIPLPEKNHFNVDTGNPFVRISYLGRSEKWKVYPFFKFLSDLDNFSGSIAIKISVITDSRQKFETILNEQKALDRRYEINYYENLTFKELETFLEKNIDINISMGYSCLESARLGIPTIIVDPSSDLSENNRYKWLFDTNNYNLGNLGKGEKPDNQFSFIEELLNKIIADKNFLSQVSLLCYKYVRENHSPKIILEKFLTIIKKNNVSLQDISNFIWIYSFSYKLYNRLKQITFC